MFWNAEQIVSDDRVGEIHLISSQHCAHSFRAQTAAQKEAEKLKKLKLEREAQLAKEAEEKCKREEGEKERETSVFHLCLYWNLIRIYL